MIQLYGMERIKKKSVANYEVIKKSLDPDLQQFDKTGFA